MADSAACRRVMLSLNFSAACAVSVEKTTPRRVGGVRRRMPDADRLRHAGKNGNADHQPAAAFLHQPAGLAEQETLAVMRADREQLAVGDLLSGMAAGQTETVGRVVDDGPFLDRKIDFRLDAQGVAWRGLVAESEQLFELGARIGTCRVRLDEFLATADEEVHGVETHGNPRGTLRGKAAEAARRGSLCPRAGEMFEQLDDMPGGFFAEAKL